MAQREKILENWRYLNYAKNISFLSWLYLHNNLSSG